MIRFHKVEPNEDGGAEVTLACTSCRPEHRIDFTCPPLPHGTALGRVAGIATRYPQIVKLAEAGCIDALDELDRRTTHPKAKP